jgi:hypothetical protein
MANILDRYGIKEVADVTFYEIDQTTKGPGAPVLYLDTLKVSTIEQTAENAEARGGKGNAALISWDYGKEITVTLEDALYSAKSLALMFGDVDGATDSTENVTILKTVRKAEIPSGTTGTSFNVTVNGATVKLTNCTYYKVDGTTTSASDASCVYAVGQVTLGSAITIDVSANSFPGTYYITGDTYARSEDTGRDEFFQFIIPKAKVMSESNTITLEAEGDPTVFNMSLKVLRPADGVMMKLVQYSLG